VCLACPNLSSAAAFCYLRLLLQANTGPQRIDSGGGAAAPSSPMRVSRDCSAATTSASTNAATGSVSGGSKGGSEWNSAGTFEEKDVSGWARRRLQVSRHTQCSQLYVVCCMCMGPSTQADVYANVLLYFTLTLTPSLLSPDPAGWPRSAWRRRHQP